MGEPSTLFEYVENLIDATTIPRLPNPFTDLPRMLVDGIEHLTTRINSAVDNTTQIKITPIKLLDPSYCGNLHASEGLPKQTILSIIGDCLKKDINFELQGVPVEVKDFVNPNKFKAMLFRAAEMGLAKGVGYLILQTDQDDDLSEPLEGQFELLNVIETDCQSVKPAEWGSEPGSYYDKVEWYSYSAISTSTEWGNGNTSRIHASRVIAFPGYTLEPRLARELGQEGIGIYQLVLGTTARYKLLDGAAVTIATSWLTRILEMTDLDLKQVNRNAAEKLRARSSAFSKALELARVVVIGQNEKFTTNSSTAAGFSELGAQIRATYCAETGSSEAVVFGSPLAGAPPDPDTVWGAYYSKCGVRQTMFIAGGACALLLAHMISKGKKVGPDDITATFQPIRDVNDKDAASIRMMDAQSEMMTAKAHETDTSEINVNLEKPTHPNTGMNTDGSLPLHDGFSTSLQEKEDPWFFGLSLDAKSIQAINALYTERLLEAFPDAAPPVYYHATIAYSNASVYQANYLMHAASEAAFSDWAISAQLSQLRVFADDEYATVVLCAVEQADYFGPGDCYLRAANRRFCELGGMSPYTKEFVPHVSILRIPLAGKSLGAIISTVSKLQLTDEVNMRFNEAVVSYRGKNTYWKLGRNAAAVTS